MSREKVYPKELIGKDIEIIQSANGSLMGIKGKIIDETRNTLVLSQDGKTKTIMKEIVKFKIIGEGIIIDGKDIKKQPEERIKG